MTLGALLVFSGIYTVFVFSPGPAVAAVMARASSVGAGRTIPFIIGIVSGDVIWFSLTALGLAALTVNFSFLFIIIKYAGVIYLFYLAYGIWTSPTKMSYQSATKGEGVKSYFGGLFLCLGNPKAIIFFVSILPNVLDMSSISLYPFLQVSCLIIIILTSCLIFYAALANHVRKFMKSPYIMRVINQCTSAVMAGAAILIAVRN